MRKRIQEEAYLYAGARVRFFETKLIGQEVLEQLLALKTSGEILDRLGEYGFETVLRPDGGVDREATLLSVIRHAYGELLPSDPHPELLQLFRYPYDCCNIKAVLKAEIRPTDLSDTLFTIGTIPSADVVGYVNARNAAALPPHMGAAMETAMTAYARTRNPQYVDLYLDRACYEDMLEVAGRLHHPYVYGLLQTKIDLTNLLTAARFLRMARSQAQEAILKESLLPGGTLTAEALLALYETGTEGFAPLLNGTPYEGLVAALTALDLRAVEKASDDRYMEAVRAARSVPYGLPVLVGYLEGLAQEVKNLRILLAGKDAGLDDGAIRERMRYSYV